MRGTLKACSETALSADNISTSKTKSLNGAKCCYLLEITTFALSLMIRLRLLCRFSVPCTTFKRFSSPVIPVSLAITFSRHLGKKILSVSVQFV